jgi:hypothetical protein
MPSALAVPIIFIRPCRGVAQPGRAPGSGPGGRRFKSSRPDQFLHYEFRVPTLRKEREGWGSRR